jgi:hypothetical protein
MEDVGHCLIISGAGGQAAQRILPVPYIAMRLTAIVATRQRTKMRKPARRTILFQTAQHRSNWSSRPTCAGSSMDARVRMNISLLPHSWRMYPRQWEGWLAAGWSTMRSEKMQAAHACQAPMLPMLSAARCTRPLLRPRRYARGRGGGCAARRSSVRRGHQDRVLPGADWTRISSGQTLTLESAQAIAHLPLARMDLLRARALGPHETLNPNPKTLHTALCTVHPRR